MPAYNEASVIENVISELKDATKKAELNCEIVVVDDGSTDKTTQIAKKAGAKVISLLLPTGSPSMPTLTGLSYARKEGFDIAATADSDGQHTPKDIIKGIELLQKNSVDFLVGNRLADSKSEMSKLTAFGNKGLSFLTRFLFGTKISDSQSGLRIFSKNALSKLTWRSNGYEFCSEMIWRAKQAGLKIDEYPIRAIYTDYSKSKGQNSQSHWNGVNIMRALIHQRIVEVFE